jgi:hypothetical protein
VYAVVYTVPPGMTTILKELRCTPSAGETTVIASYATPAGGVGVCMTYDSAVVGGTPVTHSFWLVLEAGDDITVFSSIMSARWWLSGSQLLNTAP